MAKKRGGSLQIDSDEQLTRVANNFFQQVAEGEYSTNDVGVVKDFVHYAIDGGTKIPKQKAALVFICTNPRYWEYINNAIQGAKKFFLPGHDVDILLFTDWTKEKAEEEMGRVAQSIMAGIPEPKPEGVNVPTLNVLPDGVKVIPIDAVEWPFPTLLRYHTMLQEEDTLKDYDYIFYCDIDMVFVNYVGDEILGEGLTISRHPMYALRTSFIPPYEPNVESVSFIPRPGRVGLDADGQRRYDPIYIAGGFQGGRAEIYLRAMKEMKKMVDADLSKGYIPIWNDESVLNAYMFQNQDEMERAVVLSPAYIYPDSLVNEYYIKVWGRNYTPKIVTLTKKFSTTSEGAAAIMEQMETL